MISLLASGGALLILDQWSKSTVRLFAPDRAIFYARFLRIRPVMNVNRFYRSENIRLGMAIGWLCALVSALVLRHLGMWFHGQVSLIGLGLAFGGAAGNLLDIWLHHSVVDFIDLGWWPVFNLADVAIVGGLLLAFWR